MPKQSLNGKNILITRAAHQSNEIAELVKQRGGIPILFPTIEIVPPASWDECDRALERLYMYDGVIFTSGNGVEHFLGRLKEKEGSSAALKQKMIFVVGEKTKLSVEQNGLSVTLMPERFTAFDLASAVDQRDLAGKTFLFPRGNLGKDILQDTLKLLGANVDSVVVYRTQKPKDENVQPIRSLLLEGTIDVAAFTSPSTFHNFAELFTRDELVKIFGVTSIAVIGPATARSTAAAGFEADVIATQSTIESLVDSIADTLS